MSLFADQGIELGYDSDMNANLMTVPPYACAFCLMFITSYSSDHFKERGLHISVLSLIAAICYIVMANLPDDAFHAKYGLIVSSCFPKPIEHHLLANF